MRRPIAELAPMRVEVRNEWPLVRTLAWALLLAFMAFWSTLIITA